jgi:predicted transcriptional regulator of viral defense system
MNKLLKKLYLEKKEFVTSKELRGYCKSLKLRYDTSLRSLMATGYLIRIFRGIFYVRNLDEAKLNKSKYPPLELVARAMEIKRIKHWYFGLHTALKLNNMTHEYFGTYYVVNDEIHRAKAISIAGNEFRFVKMKLPLLTFGAIRKDIPYSDPEKTILDFIYLWRYNGIPRETIIADISDWAHNLSRKKLISYAERYPKSVRSIAEEVIR